MSTCAHIYLRAFVDECWHVCACKQMCVRIVRAAPYLIASPSHAIMYTPSRRCHCMCHLHTRPWWYAHRRGNYLGCVRVKIARSTAFSCLYTWTKKWFQVWSIWMFDAIESSTQVHADVRQSMHVHIDDVNCAAPCMAASILTWVVLSDIIGCRWSHQSSATNNHIVVIPLRISRDRSRSRQWRGGRRSKRTGKGGESYRRFLEDRTTSYAVV